MIIISHYHLSRQSRGCGVARTARAFSSESLFALIKRYYPDQDSTQATDLQIAEKRMNYSFHALLFLATTNYPDQDNSKSDPSPKTAFPSFFPELPTILQKIKIA